MTRAIVVAFHKYTPFGDSYYEPILDFFLKQMKKYEDEYDKLYILDSTWNIEPYKIVSPQTPKWGIIKVDPSLRYYDAYKKVLPQIEEDLVLFMDNDFLVYKRGVIESTFDELDHPHNNRTVKEILNLRWDEGCGHSLPQQVCTDCWDMAVGRIKDYDVVSIMDTIGTWKSDKLKLGNKFCPYWFATRKELLMKYLDVDWSPDGMPDFETLGRLTKAMVEDGVRVYEMEDDKNSIYFDGTKDGEKGRNFGFYHIRSGSTPAYLLATKKYGNKDTYWKYIKEQPGMEYLRQCAWYQYMGGNPEEIWLDCINTSTFSGVGTKPWEDYCEKFKEYHGLS